MTEPEGYRDTYEKTCEALIRVAGLATAAYHLGIEHPALGSSDPVCNSFMTLLALLEEKAEAAQALHEAEWAVVVKRQPPAA